MSVHGLCGQGLKGLAKGSLAAEARRGRGRAARFLSALAGKRTALSPVPLPVFPDGEDAGKKEAFLRRMCCMAPEIGEGLWRLPGFGGSSGCDRLRDIVPFSGRFRKRPAGGSGEKGPVPGKMEERRGGPDRSVAEVFVWRPAPGKDGKRRTACPAFFCGQAATSGGKQNGGRQCIRFGKPEASGCGPVAENSRKKGFMA